MRALRAPRAALAATGVLLAMLGPASPSSAQTTDADSQLTQDGWWNRAQGSVEEGPVQEPANPLRDNVNPQAPLPSVPGNAIAVSATAQPTGAEATAIAAVGFTVAAAEGALVDSLVLTLKEAPNPGANVNSSAAKIAACPITGFWAGAKNAAWQSRPPFECADPGAVEGQRAPDGTWTFDLTSLGQAYVDGQLEPNGVVLAPLQQAPGSFQVSFLDITTGEVKISFSAMAAGGSSDFGSVLTEPTSDSSLDAGAIDVAPSEVPLSGDGVALQESVPVPAAGAAKPIAAADGAATRKADPSGLGDLPGGAFLLIPLALGAAGAAAYALGPAGRPSPGGTRAGGVSRALARRSTSAAT